MPSQQTLTLEEFNLRLESYNNYKQNELASQASEHSKVEELLRGLAQTLEELEAKCDTKLESTSQAGLLRSRLLELASKTVQLAASL